MLHPTGTLVWAKQRTYPPWPAIVAPNTSGITQKKYKKKSHTHVIFLEYDKKHAWVPTKDIAEFTGSKDDERNIKRVKSAVDTAISMMEINIHDRLIVVTNGEPVVGREGATNMQREVDRNEEDVSVHENDEAVAVNKNGRKKARVEKGVTPNRPEGAANIQHEVGRNDKDDVSDHENTEPVTVNARRNVEVVAVSPYYRPEGSTNANNRRNSPPHAQTSNTVEVSINVKMQEETWLKTLEIAPKFMEMVSKCNNADS